jgi:hypothetical protein
VELPVKPADVILTTTVSNPAFKRFYITIAAGTPGTSNIRISNM